MLVESQILVGVFLCVFVRKSLRERIAEVMSELCEERVIHSHNSSNRSIRNDG